MFIEFSKLSPEAKVWVFTSDKNLQEYLPDLNKQLNSFVEEWTAHSQNLQASFTIQYDYFIIIGVDESVNEASGCSIDKLFNEMKKLESMFHISLLDSKLLTFLDNNKIKQVSFSDLQNATAKLDFEDPDPLFFNNLVKKLKDWQTNWLVESSKSWIGKYMNKTVI